MAQTNTLLESGTNELEIVEFYINESVKGDDTRVHQSYYGINVAKVLEIIRLPELTDMPDVSHPAVLGAFNLRNRIIPLIDLERWLKKEKAETEPPKVIVTEFNKITTAFLVSGVTRIHRISWGEVEAPSHYVSSLASDSITGVVKLEGRIVFILDMEKIVAELNPRLTESVELTPSMRERLGKRPLKALVVDDSGMARRLVATSLETAGFRVTMADNGRSAWEHLESWRNEARETGRPVNEFVSVVVSDVEMPVMDGHNLTRRIKEDPMLRHTPVILCSSIVSDSLEHMGRAVGADDQISKADMRELVGRIADLLPPQ